MPHTSSVGVKVAAQYLKQHPLIKVTRKKTCMVNNETFRIRMQGQSAVITTLMMINKSFIIDLACSAGY